MAEKVAKAGIPRKKDFLLYVKVGAVWQVRKKRRGEAADEPEMVADLGLEMDPNYVYFVDRNGDVSRSSRSEASGADDFDDDEDEEDEEEDTAGLATSPPPTGTMQTLLLLGGTDDDNGDYSLLRKVAHSAERNLKSWSTLKNAKAGDEVWFYIPSPQSAVVASGLALADAEPGREWPYTMPVGDVKWLARPITLRELRQRFPDWTWAKRARVRTYLSEDIADFIRMSASVDASRAQDQTVPAQGLLPEEISETSYREGQGVKIAVNRYERDASARSACLQHFGPLCRICEVDLATVYGPIAAELVHVHHLRPFALVEGEHEVRPEEDLIPVCPNCHAVVHRNDPPLTPEEVREMIVQARTARG